VPNPERKQVPPADLPNTDMSGKLVVVQATLNLIPKPCTLNQVPPADLPNTDMSGKLVIVTGHFTLHPKP
jgi:nitrate reductase NapAB chaperone NapD